MPNVNLIAEQRSQYRRSARKTQVWFFASSATAVMSLFAVGFLLLATESKKGELRGLQAEYEKQSPIRDEIEKNGDALGLLKPRLDTLISARASTEKWSTILNHISLTMPEGTFLTNVRSQSPNDPSKPIEFELTGMSLEQNLIGSFMIALQGCPEFGTVALRYTEEKRAQQGTGLEFAISTSIAGSEDVAPKSSEEKKS